MSRSGYTEDCYGAELNLYRANVDRASFGRKGQQFFRDMVEALDAMPVKELIKNELIENGQLCAMGAVAEHRKVSLADVYPEDNGRLGRLLNIATCLAAETAYMNDEAYDIETPAQRWARMRAWAAAKIRAAKGDAP